MFIHCTDNYAILAVTRCGHTNMYYYHGMEAYANSETDRVHEWKNHHNPIVVLRNPLDRLQSATSYAAQDMVLLTKAMYRDVISIDAEGWKDSKTFMNMIDQGQQNCKKSLQALYEHSFPYMKNILVGVNFRIINFYDLDKYVPRRDELFQSRRTNSSVGDSTVEDVYVKGVGYTIEELQEEFDLYNKFMSTRERVSPEEWKELTREVK